MSEVAPSLVASSLPATVIAVYLAGAIVALFVLDAPALPRIGLALLWPLGPIAFVVTISILVAALPIAFPVMGTLALIGTVLAAVLLYRAF